MMANKTTNMQIIIIIIITTTTTTTMMTTIHCMSVMLVFSIKKYPDRKFST